MVDRPDRSLDRVFRALASAPRRDILRRVARAPRTVGELADNFDMSLAAVSKHVRVLSDAELLVQSREGRLQWCRLNPTALAPARAALDELGSFWDKQLAATPPRARARSPRRPRSARRRAARKG